MKYFLFVLSIAAFTWLVATLLRLPEKRVPWPVLIYVLSHALFYCGTWWAWLRVGQDAHSAAYKSSYAAWSVVLMASMVICAMLFICEREPVLGLAVFASCALFALCVSLFLGHCALQVYHLPRLTPTIVNHFVLAGALLCCGSVTFVSLALQSGNIESATKLALSVYWLSFACYQYVFAIASLNPYMHSATRQSWFPILSAIACCLWLSVTLNSSQSELSLQPLPHVTAAEYRTLEPSFERREI